MNEKINSQISCMANFESDFLDLIDKLKDHKGLVTGTTVKDKNIKRGKGFSQYRRDLLACAVGKGLAISNGRNPDDKKYGVLFNSTDNSNGGRFFDTAVLMSPLITDMPPNTFLDWDLNISHKKLWEVCKAEWTEVYMALCMYQCEGKISPKSLYFSSDKNIGRYRLVMIEMYIAMYDAIKIGWDELPFSKNLLFPDHNTLFVRYLYNNSILDFQQLAFTQNDETNYSSTYSNLIENREYRYGGVHHPEQYGEDEKLGQEEFIKTLKFLDESAQKIIPEGRSRDLIFQVSEMLYCLEQSSIPQVIEAAKKWRKSVSALDDFLISLIRPLKESVKNRKNFLGSRNGFTTLVHFSTDFVPRS
jgi:hypothetical protein